ncbi:MAG: TRAM domain-containing protein [Ignavibacteria bacterium]|nr:TRAM domain-containing protein [Ignavibacteria bacterium]
MLFLIRLRHGIGRDKAISGDLLPCPNYTPITTSKFATCMRPVIVYQFPIGSTIQVDYDPPKPWRVLQHPQYIHLPIQSGSDRILELMNRTYTVEHYLKRIERIKQAMPTCAMSTDIISGFCTETEEDHQRTLDVMRQVRYEGAFMFAYSPRENTKAWKMGDDVPDHVKKRRLGEIVTLLNTIAHEINETEIGKIHPVLVEGPSKRSTSDWKGRTDTNKTVVWPHNGLADYMVGDTINVKIERVNNATLHGVLMC